MDEKKLEEEYPFLNNIVLAYKDYDETVEKRNDLYSFYDKDIKYGEDKNVYTDISVKLLRNLRALSDNTYKGSKKFEYCIYLYHWIYYRTKEYVIPKLLLSEVYTEFENKKLKPETNICPYSKYSNISKELDEIIKLKIFNINFDAIIDILLNRDNSKNCKFQKFIHSCVNIYKNVNKNYCQTDDQITKTNKDICDITSEFSSGYTSYILKKQSEIEIDLPSLSSTDGEDNTGTINIVGCPSYENQEPNSMNHDQSGSSTLHTVPKILGTMAGISSFMAISYKVYEYFDFHTNINVKNTYILFNSKINIIILSYNEIYYFIIFY
ncbi:hypothetical protein PVNG_02173 [Plasmodium vivax North Korean]|uniref:Variable surface protein n=1 Tax=Plasmodium vivax North Korean TaxID=1035514 RepID=A0A0J9TTM3_PLAVI|nr:hypothetical protein PVNG_02173 [Plasmodium vivax North Korean]